MINKTKQNKTKVKSNNESYENADEFVEFYLS